MWLNTMVDKEIYVPRSERVSFDMLVRYRRDGRRATILLKNLTYGGARIEGLEGLRHGDTVTLMLPSLKPKDATVVWVAGQSAGLEFDRPLHPDVFETLVLHHGQPRERSDSDRALHREPHREPHVDMQVEPRQEPRSPRPFAPFRHAA